MVLCRLGGASFASDDLECTPRAIHQLRRLADERLISGLLVTVLLPPWKLCLPALQVEGIKLWETPSASFLVRDKLRKARVTCS